VDWLCDVLDLLLAEIVKGQRQFVADVIARRSRDANRARLGQRFQPGGDVDPIAEQIGAVDDNVANMDADAQPHRLVAVALGDRRGARRQHLPLRLACPHPARRRTGRRADAPPP